jgi:Cu(I)/Ag(I) efflux system membrane fusion protein
MVIKNSFKLINLIVLIIFCGVSFTGLNSCKKHNHDQSQEQQAVKKQLYNCPMHPKYISDRPGDCPICGMKLVPMESNQSADNSKVQGQATVNINPGEEQLIGIKTDVAKKRSLIYEIRASARVAHDVELYNAINEYRQSIITRDETKSNNSSQEFGQQAESLLNSSVLKLKHMGLSDSQINELAASTKPVTNLILTDKSGGTVWVYAQVYEYESGLVKTGQEMIVKTSALPGRTFKGIIKSVDSFLDAESRTLKVRAEIPNPYGLLKPDMYADAVINVDLGDKLSVPQEAVMDTGTRQIVFVKTKPGKYEPREVQVGYETGGYYEIISGLRPGETVVTSANFLIDSESKIKSVTK